MGKHRGGARVADILKGKAKPGVRALVELIAEVNPTDRGLSAGEASRRYAEKSALQSRLVAWYGEAFFAESTEVDDIVLLRHRQFDACACHARVSSLDDTARAWVWENLESPAAKAATEDDSTAAARGTNASARAPRSRGGAVGSEAALVAGAEEALAAYDYERAERQLVDALEVSAYRSIPAGRALVSLWIDVLGRDVEALEFAERLGAEARADAVIRSLLGLAAARTGDVPRAVSIARVLEHPRAAEVWVAIGHAALRSGDLDEARRCVSRARTLGASVESASLEVALEGALRTRAAADDARLDALFAAGDEAGAESLARELLAADLASAKAQRVVREATARHTEAVVGEVSARVRAALAARDWDAARRGLDELARMGQKDLELAARLAAAERQIALEREADLVRDALDALARAPRDEGIVQYLKLPAALRSRVRSAGPASLCALADAIDDALGPRRRAEVPTALACVVELERLVETAAVDEALEMAESLSRDLDAVPRFRRLVERARAQRAKHLAEQAHARLMRVLASLHAGDWDAASSEGDTITPAHLGSPDDKRALAKSLEFAGIGAALEADVRCARLAGSDRVALHRGRRAAEKLVKILDEMARSSVSGFEESCAKARDERARHLAKDEAELGEALAAALRVEAFDVPPGTLVDLEDEGELGAHAPDTRIAIDGRAWFIASAEDRCYLTEATLPDLGVTRRFAFSPGVERRGRSVVPVGNSLWVALSDGGMVVLDRSTPTSLIDVWWGPAAPRPIDDVWSAVAPDGSALVRTDGGSAAAKDRAPQMRSWPSGATRSLRHCASVAFFGRPGGARLLVTGDRRATWSVLESDGTRVGGSECFKGA